MCLGRRSQCLHSLAAAHSTQGKKKGGKKAQKKPQNGTAPATTIAAATTLANGAPVGVEPLAVAPPVACSKQRTVVQQLLKQADQQVC